MAFRDYIICGECETKIIYDGYDNGRDRLEEVWGDPKTNFWTVHLLCPDCLKKLRAERDAARALNSAMIATLPGTYYMDPPDGGSVMPEEQMRRMSQDAARYRWLRSDAPPESSRWPRWSLEHWSGAAWCPMRGAELDAAIDAALKDAK
jgi:hypothetical protein